MRAVLRVLKAAGLTIALWCVACSHLPALIERQQLADTLASEKSWRGDVLFAAPFQLQVYWPATTTAAERLTIYIEGDGLAWINSAQPSRDPTPLDPIALRLALAQPEGVSVYLARPCQYVDAQKSHCDQRYWTDARFGPEVIESMNAAITVLKTKFSAQQVTLVGYSGGAAVAMLAAARRDDVDRLITVAGNLDPAAWAKSHELAPLTRSLNPVDGIEHLRALKQWHFVGANDDNITPAITHAFADLFPAHQRPRVSVEAGFDHRCCWAEQWPSLWRHAMSDIAR